MNKNTLITFVLIVISALTTTLFATPPPPEPTLIPIDGGISLLVAVCVGYGVKKIYNSRKDSNPESK